MVISKYKIVFLIGLFLGVNTGLYAQNLKSDGYKGIWYTIEQSTEYGYKYSGGLGTYTANHIPLAIYAPEVDKTFFLYGGTTTKDERYLLIMISCFDHQEKTVPRPVIVYDKKGVDDPHDNGSLAIDEQGYIWVFVSGRNVTRPGLIFKSKEPYNIESFEKVHETIMTYPQPWWVEGEGFIHLFTKYTAPNTNGRELYWSVSKDGKEWSEDQKLAGMGGHYQVSNRWGNKIVTAFNYHPDGGADSRTNLYVAQTEDRGKTWQSIQGETLQLPLSDPQGETLVHDYEAEGKLVYINDLNFDKEGNPVILTIISNDFRPGPQGNPREWVVFHWQGDKWKVHTICHSTHNYDMGSLYVEEGKWIVIGPTDAGPQKYGTGGEMAIWESRDEGKNWTRTKALTNESARNHSYARRPVNAHDDFYVMWADGHADKMSESKIYFSNKQGDKVWVLPYCMQGETAYPIQIK